MFVVEDSDRPDATKIATQGAQNLVFTPESIAEQFEAAFGYRY